MLVTGGAGYIGSHAARALRAAGHKVIVYDNLSTGFPTLADGFELVLSDIADSSSLMAALPGVDAVMHFAAHAYVGESVLDPRRYFTNNVQSGITLLNAVVDARVRMFIFSSSCAVYGLPQKVPIAEDQPRTPANPYGATKLAVEHALEAYTAAYGLRAVVLRYFNAAGADESGEIGECHQPETHLIPRALEALKGTREELEIYGSDYPTPDGTCIRDYIHVSDLAEAHVAALDYLRAGGTNVAVNLGTGTGHSIHEVIAAAEALSGRKVKRRILDRRPGDPPILIADPAKARAVLGWQARRSLEQMISSAWRWLNRSVARTV